MSTTAVPQRDASITLRYLGMEPKEFGREIDQTWVALGMVAAEVAKQVEQGALRPIDGVKAIACLVGSTFGYEEFHPRGHSPDVMTSYLPASDR